MYELACLTHLVDEIHTLYQPNIVSDPPKNHPVQFFSIKEAIIMAYSKALCQ